eukprot:TRINITY_DN313_c0_g1_i1.p1 TRINITY_DN313_c0_g1~~TRINITY_DN313_c0_g1_i1.p1  ORF type:complete len:647 (+),score=170.85 TRINITY_DN313_c0_g1_i1:78-2018(+)
MINPRTSRRLDVIKGHFSNPQFHDDLEALVTEDALSPGAIALGAAGLGLFAWKKFNLGVELPFTLALIKLKSGADEFMKNNRTACDIFEPIVDATPNKAAIIFEGKTWTYRELDALANQVANWAIQKGIKKGDVVALVMENCPEYVAFWLGLSKMGAVTALINTNLRGKPITHSIGVSGAKVVVLGSEMVEQVGAVLKGAMPEAEFFVLGSPVAGYTHLNPLLAAASTKRPDKAIRSTIKSTDPLFYIYTSGTTGLPKAAIIKHIRFYLMGRSAVNMYGINSDDVIYTCLPLYHSAGGALGVGMAWGPGATMFLRRKFSATHFWDDCRKGNCTVVQYIGELCRYLLAQPPTPGDSKHNVKKAVGNGLRPDIWATFQQRFNIATVCEFYGSTEGNAALFNPGLKQGAVGMMPRLLQAILPMWIVKFDVANEVPIRGADGFCIRCGPGEVGELLGKIDMNDPLTRFDGYIGQSNTEKKILRDVFVKGDMYFRTGDLLRFDAEGFYYFVDRIGDTFRWKGENVSTNEVAEVINVFAGAKEANVYGVAVPETDGRAGMASVILEDNVDMSKLYKHICDQLPPYARPVFIRKTKEIEVTGTFKHRKVELVQEGFDINKLTDPIFFLDAKAGTYVPLTKELYERITSGHIRL